MNENPISIPVYSFKVLPARIKHISIEFSWNKLFASY